MMNRKHLPKIQFHLELNSNLIFTILNESLVIENYQYQRKAKDHTHTSFFLQTTKRPSTLNWKYGTFTPKRRHRSVTPCRHQFSEVVIMSTPVLVQRIEVQNERSRYFTSIIMIKSPNNTPDFRYCI